MASTHPAGIKGFAASVLGAQKKPVAAFLATLRYAAGVWRRASRLRASPTVRSSPLSRLRYAPRLRSSPPENILCPNDRKSFGHKKTSPSPSVRVTRGPRRYRSCGPRSRQARRFLLLRFHADKKTSGDDSSLRSDFAVFLGPPVLRYTAGTVVVNPGICILRAPAAPSGYKKNVWRRPTLPPCGSTIGAEGLNFRVRNGNGWDPFAVITRRKKLRI